MSPSTIIRRARQILDDEREAIELTHAAVGQSFVRAAEMIAQTRGKVVVTGVGKSGLIGQKIAATLSSTGTTAVFMHGGDGIHGDLGVLDRRDVVLALSFSGSTIEVLSNLPAIKRIGAKIIAMVGDLESPLAREADAVLEVVIQREACSMNLAPTSSTAAMLALGDALALILSEMREFRPHDFALYHPGGALGRKLLMTVRDLMHPIDDLTTAKPTTPITELVEILTRTPLGAVNIVKDAKTQKLSGVVTDGDIRRALLRREEFFELLARDVMTPSPTTVQADSLASEALNLMENRPSQISVLPVIDKKRRCVGMVRVHDLVSI